jgi:hypothetical protein
MTKNSSLICLCVILLIALPTKAQDIDSAWKRVIKSCAKSQIVGPDVLFFGPSNTIGLGSVWRKTDTGGYNPRFEFSDLIPDAETRKGIIKLGETLKECEKAKSKKWNLGVGLPFIGRIFGPTGIESDFRNARRVTVTADAVALDVIKEVPFEQAIKTLLAKNPNDPYVKDLLDPNRLIIVKGYRLSGLTVKLDYDPQQLEELKGKYPEGGSVNIGGEKGLNVAFNYSGDSHLTVKLPADVYIAGEFSTLFNGQLKSFNTIPDIHFQFEPVRINTRGGTIGPIDTFARKPK